MGIRIFDVDPDARPRKKFSEDIVGRFRSGTQINNRPMALTEWRVTTGDPEVADAVLDMMGGPAAQQWATQGEDNLEVFTTTKKVTILLDGPDAVRSSMALWGRNALIHQCDGETTTDGTPCPQAGKTVVERKEAAKAGYGCTPSIQLYFKLADAPDLGKFKFFSGSWGLAADIGDVEAKLAEIGGPAVAELELELIEYTTKAGRDVSYTKPVITVLRAA